MDPSTFFNTLWPTISAIIVVPLTQWLKSKMPGDWPLQATGVSVVLNFLSIFLLNEALKIGMDLGQMMPYITGGFAVSTGAHSVWKSKKKNVMTGGTK